MELHKGLKRRDKQWKKPQALQLSIYHNNLVSIGTCHSIVKKDLHLFPYRLTSVQELHPVDLPQRLEYYQWFLNTLDVHLDKTFYTDEA
jgi:hypothetical protein